MELFVCVGQVLAVVRLLARARILVRGIRRQFVEDLHLPSLSWTTKQHVSQSN